MISDKMAKNLNEQVTRELFSSYIYLAMAAHFQSKGLNGFARWMMMQSEEERGHGMKIYNYLYDQNCAVRLQKIDQPQLDYESVTEVFEETLKHEQFITSCINELVNQSIEEKDHATNGFLQWFVQEQVEEESSVRDVLDRLEFVKEVKHAIFLLDREMGARRAGPPAGASGGQGQSH